MTDRYMQGDHKLQQKRQAMWLNSVFSLQCHEYIWYDKNMVMTFLAYMIACDMQSSLVILELPVSLDGTYGHSQDTCNGVSSDLQHTTYQ